MAGILPAMLSRFALGDTLTFTRSLPDYPASTGWVLYYRLLLRGEVGAAISFNSAASGDDHLISVPAAATAAWATGTYTWSAWVARGTASYSIDAGSVDMLPNPRTAISPLDLRSPAQIALDNVRATIQGKASADVLRYEIGGRRLERYPMSDLLALEQRLAAEVSAERRAAQIAAGNADQRRYTVRLGRA